MCEVRHFAEETHVLRHNLLVQMGRETAENLVLQHAILLLILVLKVVLDAVAHSLRRHAVVHVVVQHVHLLLEAHVDDVRVRHERGHVRNDERVGELANVHVEACEDDLGLAHRGHTVPETDGEQSLHRVVRRAQEARHRVTDIHDIAVAIRPDDDSRGVAFRVHAIWLPRIACEEVVGAAHEDEPDDPDAVYNHQHPEHGLRDYNSFALQREP
mmetsp:Transcript_38040/g.87682  ORF Transcript_38040/g.87682 Transcript_38040/m.87682 type:complete len:214 (+) Transcript_38040:6182-6823(+)